jgi:hypothetical protein
MSVIPTMRHGHYLHTPEDYDGEELCPRCGMGLTTGRFYVDCTVEGWSHGASCSRYRTSIDLCPTCADLLDRECGTRSFMSWVPR